MCLKNFLDTVEQTLVNFSHADSKVDTDSDEMKLVESLCGIIASKTLQWLVFQYETGSQFFGSINWKFLDLEIY